MDAANDPRYVPLAFSPSSPWMVIVHPILDQGAGTIGPGAVVSRHRARQGAEANVARRVDGTYASGPVNVVRVANSPEAVARPYPDEVVEWWYAAPVATGHSPKGNLIGDTHPMVHYGAPLTIVDGDQ